MFGSGELYQSNILQTNIPPGTSADVRFQNGASLVSFMQNGHQSEQILFTDHEWRFGSQQEELQEEHGSTLTKPLKKQTLIPVASYRHPNLGQEKMHVEDIV